MRRQITPESLNKIYEFFKRMRREFYKNVTVPLIQLFLSAEQLYALRRKIFCEKNPSHAGLKLQNACIGTRAVHKYTIEM